jgi:uncharacterized Zn-binding protein involved in type VI secretion
LGFDDVHQCGIKPPPPHLAASPVIRGSATVSIGGKQRPGSATAPAVAATILVGATNVFIGG